METAIAYCRVSDPRQVDEGNSLATQEKQAREYAARHDDSLLRLFIERGESAKTDSRPVLQEMLAFCKQHARVVRVVIIPKIDRLARNAHDYASLKMMLARLNIRVESIGERIEDSPVGRFTEGILAHVAQFDNEIRSERSRNGMVDAVREGRWVWRAPKGYCNVKEGGKANIAPDERLGPVMAEAFERIASGSHSSQEVCRWLQAQGVRVTLPRLHEILRNKAYLGVIESFGLIQKGSPPFVPLVTPETFFRAQEALRRKTEARIYDRDNPDFPLRGTLVCECGKHHTGYWAQGRSEKYGYYRCMACLRTNHPRDEIERAFRSDLSEYRFLPGYVNQVKEAILRRWRVRFEEELGRADRARKEIEEMTSLQGKIVLKLAEGVIPDDLAKRQIDEIGKKIAALAEEKDGSLSTEQEITRAVDFGTAFLSEMPSYWASSELPEQKKLQLFLYPRGLVYMKNGRFRTSDYPLQEGIKEVAHRGLSDLVDPDDDFTNRLLQFLKELTDRFS